MSTRTRTVPITVTVNGEVRQAEVEPRLLLVHFIRETLGLTGTQLQRKMFDYEARDRGLENITTAADIARLLRLIATRQILTPEACDLAIDIMARQQVRDRLPLYLPDDMHVAHKTGELPGVRHDSGVIFFDSGPVIVVALTQGFPDPLSQSVFGGDASALIAQIPRVLLKHQRQ